jgi:hypothetical protein
MPTTEKLRDECDKRGIAFPVNANKGELIALLKARRRNVFHRHARRVAVGGGRAGGTDGGALLRLHVGDFVRPRLPRRAPAALASGRASRARHAALHAASRHRSNPDRRDRPLGPVVCRFDWPARCRQDARGRDGGIESGLACCGST